MNIAEGLNLIPYGTEDDLYVNGRITGNSLTSLSNGKRARMVNPIRFRRN